MVREIGRESHGELSQRRGRFPLPISSQAEEHGHEHPEYAELLRIYGPRGATDGTLRDDLSRFFSLFCACSQTGIFASIENEERSRARRSTADIFRWYAQNPTGSLKIYLSNGYVWTKTASESSWTKIVYAVGDDLPGTRHRQARRVRWSLYGLFSLGSDWTADRSVRKWDAQTGPR
jgi:hypothetical protein